MLAFPIISWRFVRISAHFSTCSSNVSSNPNSMMGAKPPVGTSPAQRSSSRAASSLRARARVGVLHRNSACGHPQGVHRCKNIFFSDRSKIVPRHHGANPFYRSSSFMSKTPAFLGLLVTLVLVRCPRGASRARLGSRRLPVLCFALARGVSPPQTPTIFRNKFGAPPRPRGSDDLGAFVFREQGHARRTSPATQSACAAPTVRVLPGPRPLPTPAKLQERPAPFPASQMLLHARNVILAPIYGTRPGMCTSRK